jgi:hypothetical protein
MLTLVHHPYSLASKRQKPCLECVTTASQPRAAVGFCEDRIGEKLVVYHGLLQWQSLCKDESVLNTTFGVVAVCGAENREI